MKKVTTACKLFKILGWQKIDLNNCLKYATVNSERRPTSTKNINNMTTKKKHWRLTCSRSSPCCCVSPLTRNTSAVLRNEERDRWCTLTSPWYINSTRAWRSVHATSWSTITGCLQGVDWKQIKSILKSCPLKVFRLFLKKRANTQHKCSWNCMV